MTEDEFRSIAKSLKLAYRRDNFLSDNDTMNLWYEHIGGEKYTTVSQAVKNYIDKNTFQPTIADIKNECEKIQNHIAEINSQLREIYGRTKGVYPNLHLNDDEQTQEEAAKRERDAWMQLIIQKPLEERVAFAKRVEDVTNRYVKKIEADPNRQVIPPLDEFFRGAR